MQILSKGLLIANLSKIIGFCHRQGQNRLFSKNIFFPLPVTNSIICFSMTFSALNLKSVCCQCYLTFLIVTDA